MHIDFKNILNNAECSINNALLSIAGGKLFLFYSSLPDAAGGGFQGAECNYFLENFPMSANFSMQFENTKDFKKARKGYFKLFPNAKKAFFQVNTDKKYNFQLAYGVFLNNIYNYLEIFEKNNIPFIFVLYPGGGFGIDNEESDRKLKRVFSSKMFVKVITTMPASQEYLLNKNLCPEEKIEYIYGVVPQNKGSFEKYFYKKDKDTFDICFIAHKYSSKGQDKGYDTFIETAQKLAPVNKDIHFHIIGPWENTIDTSSINPEQLHFYGTKPGCFLAEFYKKADIIITANRYQMIYPGNFDGYPLGIEASLAGVYVMNTDPLNMKPKTPLKDIKGFEVITNDADRIAESIIKKLDNLEAFYKDTKEQHEGAIKIFDKDIQLKARLDIVKQYVK